MLLARRGFARLGERLAGVAARPIARPARVERPASAPRQDCAGDFVAEAVRTASRSSLELFVKRHGGPTAERGKPVGMVCALCGRRYGQVKREATQLQAGESFDAHRGGAVQ